MEQNQVAVVTPADAKVRALAILKQHTEAVSYVRQEDLDTQGMFLPVVCVIPLAPSDLHNLAGGMMMPKKHHVDRMAEAAGVNVTSVNVTKASEYVWNAKAHGTRRMPDGTMREGEGEYSFDAEKYAELDFLKDGDKSDAKYTSEKAKRVHLLEYAKFGHQRASTGARLALIRFFCKCPTAFKRDDLPKAMAFARVDVNTDALLASPEMRDAAVAHAVGAASALFGPTPQATRNVTPAPQAIEGPAITDDDEPDFGDAPEPVVEDETPEQKAMAEARSALRDWLETPAVKWYSPAGKKSAAQAITEVLAKKDASLEELQAMIKLCSQTQASYERSRAKGGAA